MVDYSQPTDQVRLLISDVSTDPAKRVLADGEIAGYLVVNGDDVRRAAADALDAIATSEALVGKVIRTQDLTTDAAKLADALRKHADRLRAQADQADADADDFAFDVVYPAPARRPEHSDREVWGL